MSEPARPQAAAAASPRWSDRLLFPLAVGLGTGFAPRAPGTFGSLLGPPLAYALGADGSRPLWAACCGMLLFAIGVPICNAGVRLLRVKDPKQVVFDEIAAFCWVYLLTPITLETLVLGFLLFRLFDILKPWPVRALERLPGGLGVMADDAGAALLAAAVLGAISWTAL